MKIFKIKISKVAQSDVYYDVWADDAEKAKQVAVDYASSGCYLSTEEVRQMGPPVIHPTTFTPVVMSL